MNYRKQLLCRMPEALGKVTIALGKGFAECRTRQRTLGKIFVGKGFFAECLRRLSAKKSYRHGGFLTNGCFCRVSPGKALGKELKFFSRISLPSASRQGTSRGSAGVDPASAARCASHGGGTAPGCATRGWQRRGRRWTRMRRQQERRRGS